MGVQEVRSILRCQYERSEVVFIENDEEEKRSYFGRRNNMNKGVRVLSLMKNI